ncbi:MAG: hypothetical protein RIE32_01075 [Phycisphaerales bacterium]
MPASRGNRVRAILLSLLAASTAGCVVDEQRTEALREERDNAPPTLPADPIARPVISGTTASRVSVSVESLGTIAYDGLSVPMVSPDGQFLATQDSPAPPRDQRLATSGVSLSRGEHATVSIAPLKPGVGGFRTSVEVFDLETPILLGRDTDVEGVLVESPRPDGTRWIGIARWSEDAAGVRWLVRDDSVSAHAVFAGNGALLYCRRGAGEQRFSLVWRGRDGERRRLSLPDADLVFPLLAPDQRYATCLAVRDGGAIDILLIDLTTRSGGDVGRVVRRWELAASGGIPGAAQIVAASQSAVQGLSASDALDDSAVAPTEASLGPIFFHPAMDRCAAVDTSRRSLVAMAPKSVAAVDAGDGRALCSTPDGLVLWTPGPQAGRGTATRVLSEDYLPRRTASVARPFVLFAPMRRSATDLMVFGMAPASAP